MSIYATVRYAEPFYGSDENNDATGGPAGLTAYQNNIDSIVFYWRLEPVTSSVGSFLWTVETDLVDDFSSPEKKTFLSTDLDVTYIPGKVHQGMAVDLPYSRQQGATTEMFWRVKGTIQNADTVWTGSTFSIPQAIDGIARNRMLSLMPDPIYKKDAGSNNYNMLWSYGQVLDLLYVQYLLANNDIYLESVRDANIQKKFGNLVKISKPGLMRAIDFREILRSFYVEARNSPVVRAIVNTTMAALGTPPTLINIRDANDFQVADDTIGQTVDPFYVEDDSFYQVLTFDGPLVAGNIYTVSVDGNPVITNFITDSNTTMSAIAVNMASQPSISAAYVLSSPGPDNNRVIIMVAANPFNPPILTDSLVTGGADQAHAIQYQSVVFDGPMLPGNVFTMAFDHVGISVPFRVNSGVTMGDIASAIAGVPGVSSASIIPSPFGPNYERIIVIQWTDPMNPPFLSDPNVYGGISQPEASLSLSSGKIIPATVWDNVHLAGGIIAEVTNPLGAFVDRAFLQSILRKLVPANSPLYVTGIA